MRTNAPRRALRAALVATLLLTGIGTAEVSAAVSTAPARPDVVTPLSAPTGLKAVRSAANPNDFVISWNALTNTALHHYNVSVYHDGIDDVTVVPAGTTTLAVTGVTLGTTYRLTVGSRDANGEGTTSGYYWLYPALPGSVLGLTSSREVSDPKVGTVSWKAPTRPGYTPLTQYNVVVTRMVDGVVVMKQSSLELSAKLVDLDPARSYSVKVTAVNTIGDGPVATTTIASDRPGTPTGLTAVRDTDNPGVVHLQWKAPSATGLGPITGYEVVYGSGYLKDTLAVDASGVAEVPLDAARNGVVPVRASNINGCGYISTVVTVLATGRAATVETATTNPSVLMSYENGVVSVQTTDVVGTTALYPRLVVRIAPTVENGGFRDTQWGQNGAKVLTFRIVPAGNFTITVHGVATSGAETELARKVIVTEGYGTLLPNQWQLVLGKADIGATRIDMVNAGENRVLSVKPLTSPDMVLTTDATLRSGWGYGVWFRTELDAQKRIAGYTFQYDPMYGNAFIIRHWYQGKECSTPLAKTPFPKGFDIYGQHRLVVVAKGDSIWASVDGLEVFRLDSLSKAIAASPCQYPAPVGTRIGFRSWNSTSAVFENTTLS